MLNKSRWSRDEELMLIRDISTGINIETIATKHNRSSSAVELRLKKIIYENAMSGRSIENISKLLKLNEEKTRQYFYSYKEFKEKHTGLIEDNSKLKQDNRPQTGIQKGGQLQIPQNIPQNIQQNIPQNTYPPNIQNIPLQNVDITQLPTINNQLIQPQHFGGETARKLHKIQSKMHKIENENKALKLIVENKELTQQLNKMIKEGKVDKSVKKLIKVMGEIDL